MPNNPCNEIWGNIEYEKMHTLTLQTRDLPNTFSSLPFTARGNKATSKLMQKSIHAQDR